jgi:hypothetical protein
MLSAAKKSEFSHLPLMCRGSFEGQLGCATIPDWMIAGAFELVVMQAFTLLTSMAG